MINVLVSLLTVPVVRAGSLFPFILLCLWWQQSCNMCFQLNSSLWFPHLTNGSLISLSNGGITKLFANEATVITQISNKTVRLDGEMNHCLLSNYVRDHINV